jgi:hypothetical protein
MVSRFYQSSVKRRHKGGTVDAHRVRMLEGWKFKLDPIVDWQLVRQEYTYIENI